LLKRTGVDGRHSEKMGGGEGVQRRFNSGVRRRRNPLSSTNKKKEESQGKR